MNLSVMLFPFHRALSDEQLDPAAFLRALRSEGVSAIEPMASWVRSDPAHWDRFRRTIEDVGLVHSCYDIGVNFIGTSPADRETALDTVEREVAFCRDTLRCSLALLPGTRPAPGMSEAEGRRIYGQMLARAAERTRGSGVVLMIEDFGVYPGFACAAGHCLEVLEVAGESVRLTFDNGNFLLAGERPLDAYAMARPRIAHVHIKDFCRSQPGGSASLNSVGGIPYRGCPIGEGDAQVRECVSTLRTDGYGARISIEVGSGDPVDQAMTGARVIREAWGV